MQQRKPKVRELVDLQEVCYTLTETAVERLNSQIERSAPRSNWASQIGHPCERFLYHARIDWQQRDKHDHVLQSIFNEGNLHEQAVIREIQDDCNERGWAVVGQQDRFYDEELQVGGKIDLDILIPQPNGETWVVPCEIKSCSPTTFNQINTQDDIMKASKYYIRNYYDQLMSYLYMHNKELGILVLKNKLTGMRKYVPIYLDYEHFSETVEKLKRVNKSIAAKEPPKRLLDFDICEECAFRHICITDDIKMELPKLDNETLLFALEEKEYLKASYDDYMKAQKVVKAQIDLAEDTKFSVGDYVVSRKWFDEKDVPATTRKGYWRNTIKKVLNGDSK